MLLALICVSLSSGTHSPVNGEQAVATVRATLAEFGHRQSTRLGTITSSQMFDKPSVRFWNVELTSPTGPISARVRADSGRVVSLKFPDRRPIPYLARSADPTYRERAVQLVGRLQDNRPVRIDMLSGKSTGPVFATYKLLIEGHPFLDAYTNAGYSVTFDAKTKDLIAFETFDEPPPIDPRPARIDRSRAESLIRKYVKERLLPEGYGRSAIKFDKIDYRRPEYGYVVLRGEKQARRVWRGSFSIATTNTLRAFPSRRIVQIDAVTGQLLPLDRAMG